MPTQRSNIKTGPAIVIYRESVFYFKAGLTIDEVKETFEINVDAFGKVDERVKDRRATIKGTPAGEWENITTLFPYVEAIIGSRIYGEDADEPLVVHGRDGTRWTYHNAALTQMPGLTFAPTETLLGDVEFTALVADGAEPEDENSLVTRTTAPFADTSFSTAAIKTQRYVLSWGDAPWDSFRTVDGTKIAWTLGLADILGEGVVKDRMITGLGVTATFKPFGVPQEAIDTKLAMQGSEAAAQGASLNASGTDLILTGAGVYVAIRGAAAKSAQSVFGLQAQRSGDLVAVATRTFTNGVADPLAFLGTEAPVVVP